MAQGVPARRGERRVARENELRILPGGLQQRTVHLDAGDAEARHAGLARAEHIALAAQAKVFLGDAEAVFGLAQDFDARLGGFAKRRAVELDASRMLVPSSVESARLIGVLEY